MPYKPRFWDVSPPKNMGFIFLWGPLELWGKVVLSTSTFCFLTTCSVFALLPGRKPQGKLRANRFTSPCDSTQLSNSPEQWPQCSLCSRSCGHLSPHSDGQPKDRTEHAHTVACDHDPTVSVCGQMMPPLVERSPARARPTESQERCHLILSHLPWTRRHGGGNCVL